MSGRASVRDARVEDAARIGEIHVRAWQTAYVGVMPQAYLDGLRAEDRARMWRDHLAGPTPGRHLLVVDDGGVQGFASMGPEENGAGRADTGELYGINLDPPLWGRGLGRLLLRAATDRLADDGYERCVLWVVPANARARGLYESEGWSCDGGEREEDLLGVRVAELRYARGR